jgi:DegV family protein with EDD domain
MTICVVTDSTADLPPQVAEEYGITVIPLNIHFGDQTLKDGIDIKPEEFYEKLPTADPLPKTSQPSAGEFLELYEKLAESYDGILSIHLANKLSGTYNSAITAARMYKGACPIEVIDTGTVSVAIGMTAMAAARAARQGASLQEAAQVARESVSRTSVAFFVETLHYLEKGGRIGKARAWVGSLLHLRPLLTVRDGEVHPVDKARTRAKAMVRTMEFLKALGTIEEAAVVHSTTPEDAQELARQIRELAGESAIITVSRIGPVVGTYAGPGVVGAAVRVKA